MYKNTIGMILDNAFPPDIRVEKEAFALIEAGYDVHLICRNKGGETSYENINGLNLHRINYSPPHKLGGYFPFFHIFLYDRIWLKNIITICIQHSVDYLHIHDLPLVLTAQRASQKLGLPCIFDMHENWPEGLKIWMKARTSSLLLYARDSLRNILLYNSRRYKKLEKKCLKNIDRVIVVIDEQKKRLVNLGVNEEIISIVKNTVDLKQFDDIKIQDTLRKKYETKFVILYVGGFSFARGLETLIEAVALAKAKIDNIHLILVGDGNAKPFLETTVLKFALSENTDFTGWVDFSEVPRYIAASDICVVPHSDSPHTRTTIPHKLFQYMAMRKPVIATSVGPLQRIVTESGSGLIAEAGNAREMAESIIKLHNADLAKKLGENGRNAVERKYNWQHDAAQLVDLYNKI